jgi:zinc protease
MIDPFSEIIVSSRKESAMKGKMLMFLVFLLVAGTALAAPPAGKIFPYAYEKYTLANGFTAYLIPVKGSGLVAYYSVARTGSRDEWEPGKTGFAHFFEHMMFRGTKNYPSAVYDRMVTEIGASANAYTTDDYTCYHMDFPAESLETVIALESDRFKNLAYPESEFKTEAGAVYGEFLKGRVDPDFVMEEALQDTAFDVHTYKHTTMGFEKDIKEMPNQYDYSLTFFQRYYRPENVVLLMAGDFDPETAKHLLEQYYADWKPGYVAPRIQTEPEQKGERVKEVTYSGKTLPILCVAYKVDAFDPADPTMAAADLLADLAFGEDSEIYKDLVLREQKVQIIRPMFPLNRDPSLFAIYAMVKDEKDIPAVRDAIDRTVETFTREPVDEKRLENLKKRTRYAFLMGLDTPAHIAGMLARFVAVTGGIEGIDTDFAAIASVTPEQARAAARKFLIKEHRTVIVLKGGK